MSECVVRMEMPESCKKCISTNCIWGKEGSDYLDVIAALHDFRKTNNAGFPDFCPIICQLPKGHGDLIDRDSMVEEWVDEKIGNPHSDYEADDVIYDLKKRTVIVPKDKAHWI